MRAGDGGLDANLNADDVIAILGLAPHPEGGYFVETFRDKATLPGSDRALSTAIYFLLREGAGSHWHTVDAVEMWHFHAGAPVLLGIAAPSGPAEFVTLGMNLAGGHRPQAIVPQEYWQSARSLGAWSLVGCTVSPGFTFEGFKLAPPGWEPK